jgi:hypothetical protein
MRGVEFTADIKSGMVIPPNHVCQFLRHCEGKQARIILSWGLKKRTLKQNSYYKGIVLPQFTAYLRGEGCKVKAEQVDSLIKQWCDFTREVELPGGRIESVPRSTTECDTKEMSEFTERAIAEIAVRFGFYVPLPHENQFAEGAA